MKKHIWKDLPTPLPAHFMLVSGEVPIASIRGSNNCRTRSFLILLKNNFMCYEGRVPPPPESQLTAGFLMPLGPWRSSSFPCSPATQTTAPSLHCNSHTKMEIFLKDTLEQNNWQWLQHLLSVTNIINFHLILIFICLKLLGLRYLNFNYYGSN